LLNQDAVNDEEERLRIQIASLTAENRKKFYSDVKRHIKDPDTYAALNWFFISGIHHFYLGKWAFGILDLFLFVVGLSLIFMGYQMLGFVVIVGISIAEFWALFRSQIIIQDWNNQIYQNILNDIDPHNKYK
jgi:TM2 domain-containing membrane protein YozV